MKSPGGCRTHHSCEGDLRKWRRGDVRISEDAVVGQLSADHRDFVAGMEPRTFEAIFIDLVRQVLAPGYGKSEVREEIREPGEEAHALHVMVLGLNEKRLDQKPPCTLALVLGAYCDRAQFGEMRPIEMKRA